MKYEDFFKSIRDDFADEVAARVMEKLRTIMAQREKETEYLSQKKTAEKIGVSEAFLILQRKKNKISFTPFSNKIRYDVDHLVKELRAGEKIPIE